MLVIIKNTFLPRIHGYGPGFDDTTPHITECLEAVGLRDVTLEDIVHLSDAGGLGYGINSHDELSKYIQFIYLYIPYYNIYAYMYLFKTDAEASYDFLN